MTSCTAQYSKPTVIRLEMVVNIIRCWESRRIAANVLLSSSLVHTHVVDAHLSGEYHGIEINRLPVGCGSVVSAFGAATL